MPPKKDAPAPKDHFPDVMIFLFVLALLMASGYALHISDHNSVWYRAWQAVVDFFANHLWPVLRWVGVASGILAFMGLIYYARKMTALSEVEALVYHPEAGKEPVSEAEAQRNERWERIITHLNSPNSAEWRLAIMDADIMLEDLLRKQAYHGESIGDLLKEVEPSDMRSLDAAWEAHKVRNRIAHDGASFELNEREAKRVIGLYEQVFKEFSII